jgi:lipid-A-disaccharide synthase-like uncharacterized protein
MNKKLVAPFVTWLLFMVVGLSGLINGIQHQDAWRVAAAGISLLVSSGFLYFIIQHTAKKELKAVRVRK